jgi:inhibitor of the pro-sigma K processing machinery
MDNTLVAILIVAVAVSIAVLSQLKWSLLHLVGKGMVHFVIGGFILFFVNLFGGIFEFTIPLNVVTVAVVGLLGLPGVISLVCIKLLIF